jgi:hypothetical protein
MQVPICTHAQAYLNYMTRHSSGLITNDEVVRIEQLKCNDSSSAAVAADSTNGLIL